MKSIIFQIFNILWTILAVHSSPHCTVDQNEEETCKESLFVNNFFLVNISFNVLSFYLHSFRSASVQRSFFLTS